MEKKNKKVDRKKGAKPQEKKKSENVKQKHEKITEPFAYKMYEVVFLSLLLSAFVSLLEIGSQKDLNLYLLIAGHSSLFLPLILSVAIYHTLYLKRLEFTQSLIKWTYGASILTVFLTFSIFQEIIPILGSLDNQSNFIELYSQHAALHPVVIILLSLCYFWVYHRAFGHRPHWVVVFSSAFILSECLILGTRIESVIGKTLATSLGIIILFLAKISREHWLRD